MGNSESVPGYSSAEADFLQQTVKRNCIVIFSKTYCPACDTAKRDIESLGLNYHVIELNRRTDCSKMMAALYDTTNMKTVPQIFVNGRCVGGSRDLRDLIASNLLVKLVNECYKRMVT